MPLSTKELINNIPNEPDIKNARYVRISRTAPKTPYSYEFETVTNIPGQRPRKHKQWIEDLSKKGLVESKDIWVSCSCPRFKFMWEYALAKIGASSIKYSNGEPPVETNPRLKKAACKHVFVCLNNILRKRGKFGSK